MQPLKVGDILILEKAVAGIPYPTGVWVLCELHDASAFVALMASNDTHGAYAIDSWYRISVEDLSSFSPTGNIARVPNPSPEGLQQFPDHYKQKLMEETHIQQQITLAFEYCYSHNDWITPLETVLSGVDAAQAARRTGSHAKSIWEVVLHMAVWNENIIERIRTREPVRPQEGAWPAPSKIQDEREWEAAKTRLRQAIRDVQSMLDHASLSQIMNSPYGLADLICRFIHNGYHIGQLTILTRQ